MEDQSISERSFTCCKKLLILQVKHLLSSLLSVIFTPTIKSWPVKIVTNILSTQPIKDVQQILTVSTNSTLIDLPDCGQATSTKEVESCSRNQTKPQLILTLSSSFCFPQILKTTTKDSLKPFNQVTHFSSIRL
jgi:hypothetical protein